MTKLLTCCFAALLLGCAVKAQNPYLSAGAGIGGKTAGRAAATTPAAPAKEPAQFQFKDKDNTYDFGKIPEGPSVTHEFVFKNTGKLPLIITNGQASCGCTSPKWPEEPVLPGKSGKITVTFNTENKAGTFTKTVYLTSNAVVPNGGDRIELFIKGDVTPKSAASPTH